MKCLLNLGGDAIAKPLTHDRKAVGVAESTDDCGGVAMSVLTFDET